jgi:hypothetical protein
MSNLSTSLLSLILAIIFGALFFQIIRKWTNFLVSMFGKVLKVILLVILALAILISLLSTYEKFSDYWEKDRMRIVYEYSGIKLKQSEDEVYFIKGKPLHKVLDQTETNLFYKNGLRVEVSGGKVISISINCRDSFASYSIVFGGVGCHSSLETLHEQYGETSNISSSPDKTSRIYNFPKYNLAYELSEASVIGITIFDSSIAKDGYFYVTPKPSTPKPPPEKPVKPAPANNNQPGGQKLTFEYGGVTFAAVSDGVTVLKIDTAKKSNVMFQIGDVISSCYSNPNALKNVRNLDDMMACTLLGMEKFKTTERNVRWFIK